MIEDIEKKYAYKEKANRVSILFLPFDDHEKSRNSGAEAEAETKAADTKQAQNEHQVQQQPHEQPTKNGTNHLLYVNCDSQKISQVVFNLLDNAMKFTTDGKIVVTTTITDESASPSSLGKDIQNAATTSSGNEDGVGSNHSDDGKDGDSHVDGQKKESVLVTVQDTGVGINSKIKDQLFEKFVTKSNQGTGLGLYLSKKIVEEHGGRIWFEERNDDGDNSNNKNKNGGIGDMLHHLGNGKKIGATFKFSIPVSVYDPYISKMLAQKNDEQE